MICIGNNSNSGKGDVYRYGFIRLFAQKKLLNVKGEIIIALFNEVCVMI